jgi:hypothetical protein
MGLYFKREQAKFAAIRCGWMLAEQGRISMQDACLVFEIGTPMCVKIVR